jgi:signal peptidase II
MGGNTWEVVRSAAAWTRFLVPVVAGLSLDLWSKWYAFEHLALSIQTLADGSVRVVSDVYELIPGWLHFQVTANQGAVFGAGQGHGWLFVIAAVGAALFITGLFAASGRQRWMYQIVLGMLLAGVLGNLYDRVVHGHVRDLIFALPGVHWPGTWQVLGYPHNGREVFPWIFNVADSLLCVGVALMLVLSSFHHKQPTGDSGGSAAPPDAARGKTA